MLDYQGSLCFTKINEYLMKLQYLLYICSLTPASPVSVLSPFLQLIYCIDLFYIYVNAVRRVWKNRKIFHTKSTESFALMNLGTPIAGNLPDSKHVRLGLAEYFCADIYQVSLGIKASQKYLN